MRWLTNGHRSEQTQYLRDMTAGHEGKRRVIIGDPKPGKYTVDDLKNMGYLGYYEVERCQCDFCRKIREEKYYKPLEDWRKMNKQILEEKAKKSREQQIRRANKYPPRTYRIVLDMGVNDKTRQKLCAFAGDVITALEYSNMLGYAIGVKRSESTRIMEHSRVVRVVQYDLIVDTDVSSTIEGEITAVLGQIHTEASRSGLIGHGLNIINMDVRK